MNLTRAAINNKASTFVVLVLITVIGAASLYQLPIQLIPDVEQPQITISTAWRNAAPSEMESVIIEPIESVVKATPGVVKVTSIVQRGSGSITLLFPLGADMQKAMIDVLNNINQAPPMPLDAIDPVVSTDIGPNAASLMIKTLPGNNVHDLGVYEKLIEDVVKPALLRVPGVASVKLESSRPTELRINFDPFKMAALGLNTGDVRKLVSESSDSSAGIANVGRRQYTVRFAGQYSVEELNNMVIAYRNNTPIFVRDVATVEMRLVDRTEFYLRNGRAAYYLTLRRHEDANTVQLIDRLNIALFDLNEGALAEAKLAIDLSFDSSVHIRNALSLVQSSLGLGVLLSLAILLLFLRGMRSVLIIALSIPCSLLIAFIALRLFDRSLNVISLAGLAFSVGLVLDAAIIVQENILQRFNKIRKKESSDTPSIQRKDAQEPYAQSQSIITQGTTEVAGALLTSTATSVAIFVPILFMVGVEGQLFSDLALTMSVAVVASLLSALIVIPIVNLLWAEQKQTAEPYAHHWQKISDLSMRATDSTRKQIIWLAGLLGGAAIMIALLMPNSDFLPRAPIDGFFMNLNMPAGGNSQYIESEVADIVKARLEPYLNGSKEPKIKSYNLASYSSQATFGFLYLEDARRVEELMDIIKTEVMTDLPEIRVSLSRGSMISVAGGGSARTIDIDISGPDLNNLMQAAELGLKLVRDNIPGTSAFSSPSLVMSEPTITLSPLDHRIALAGLTRNDITNAVSAYTGGLFLGEYFDGNKRVNVVLRGPEWQTPEELMAMPLHTPFAGLQTIGDLNDIELSSGPSLLRRVNGRRTVSLTVTPPKDASLEKVIGEIEELVLPGVRASLDSQSSVHITGNANKMAAAISELSKSFLFAVFILVLLMSALFKSLRDSLLVVAIMPIAVAGGVLALSLMNVFTFQSLDLLTMVGFVTLLGLVVNNAILIIDQTRRGQTSGLSIDDAVAQAIKLRAKPVYMSSLTSVFGMLPLMLLPGVGSEIYRGLATVIVGGMLLSSLFSMILFPALLRFNLAALFEPAQPIHDSET